MKKRLLGALSVVGLAGLVVGVYAAPASAGDIPDEALPSLTVQKVVVADDTSYDLTGVFTIQVSCDDVSAELTFDVDGTPLDAPEGWVNTGSGFTYQGWPLKYDSCTVVEEANGAAIQHPDGDPTYSCTFTNEKYVTDTVEEQEREEVVPGCVNPEVEGETSTSPAQVQFGAPWDHTCVTPDDAESLGKCLCVQSGTVVVTNKVATHPAKVASEAVNLEPKFTG